MSHLKSTIDRWLQVTAHLDGVPFGVLLVLFTQQRDVFWDFLVACDVWEGYGWATWIQKEKLCTMNQFRKRVCGCFIYGLNKLIFSCLRKQYTTANIYIYSRLQTSINLICKGYIVKLCLKKHNIED